MLDNGSTDPAVIRIQSNAEQKDPNALWNDASRKDFLDKDEIIAGVIRRPTGLALFIEAPTSRN